MSIRIEGKAIKKSTKLEFIHPEIEMIQKINHWQTYSQNIQRKEKYLNKK